MKRNIKVRLTEDLTRYHPGLIPGVEGITIGQYGMWSRNNDRFIGVLFRHIGIFHILWEGLEIIDTEYLSWAAEQEMRKWELLTNAKNVVRVVGPRGGFKHLSYEYINGHGTPNHCFNGSRQESEKLISFFRKHGIEIREEVLK